METEELKKILIDCIEILYKRDFHLLKYNLSERSISHKLATYLTEKVSSTNLDVDCEYNGDIENAKGNYRKRIEVLNTELVEIKNKIRYPNEEIQSLAVYPDIIIHKRGENKKNCLIIEIKKEYPRRQIDDEFDRLKLYHYTSDYHGNHLKYKLGAYIEFDTSITNKSYRIDFYQNGIVIDSINKYDSI